MEYSFKQMPKQQYKKVVLFCIATAIASLSLMFVTLNVTDKKGYSEQVSIALCVVSFAIPAVISIYWFFRKYAVQKTIKIAMGYIEIQEVNPRKQYEESLRTYQLTPEMIKSFCYRDNSDNAFFCITTHNKDYETIIPESIKKLEEFNRIKSQLEDWLKSHNIKEG